MGEVFNLPHLILEELPHACVLSPSIPNHVDIPVVFFLSHLHPGEVLVHEVLVPSEPLLGLLSDLGLSEMLLPHEVLQVLNHPLGLPVRSSLWA